MWAVQGAAYRGQQQYGAAAAASSQTWQQQQQQQASAAQGAAAVAQQQQVRPVAPRPLPRAARAYVLRHRPSIVRHPVQQRARGVSEGQRVTSVQTSSCHRKPKLKN